MSTVSRKVFMLHLQSDLVKQAITRKRQIIARESVKNFLKDAFRDEEVQFTLFWMVFAGLVYLAGRWYMTIPQNWL